MKRVLLGFIIIHFAFKSEGQIVTNYLGDESYFYAQTKQINQFFRRFNAEEDLQGERLYKGDKYYRDLDLREKYLKMLFDMENPMIGGELKDEFISDVTDKSNPEYLDFYGGKWFAEVTASFDFKGKTETAVIFLELEHENLGMKWVINKVYFKPFADLFFTDSLVHKFIHPMSHELDFMNLIKVFQDKNDVEYYFDKDYRPDLKSIFLYEIKKGGLTFITIQNVRFHFFQIKNWYFEISEFNRSSKNSGWLISALTKIPEEQKDLLLKYIYYEK